MGNLIRLPLRFEYANELDDEAVVSGAVRKRFIVHMQAPAQISKLRQVTNSGDTVVNGHSKSESFNVVYCPYWLVSSSRSSPASSQTALYPHRTRGDGRRIQSRHFGGLLACAAFSKVTAMCNLRVGGFYAHPTRIPREPMPA